MPELAVTVSATVTGNSVLAVNNLLGGIAMQVAILAIADAAIGRRALSSSVPDPTVLLQGSLCIVLLSIAATATLIDDVAIFGVGISLWLLIGGFIYAITALSQAGDTRPWMVPEQDQRATDGEKDKNDGEKEGIAASYRTY